MPFSRPCQIPPITRQGATAPEKPQTSRKLFSFKQGPTKRKQIDCWCRYNCPCRKMSPPCRYNCPCRKSLPCRTTALAAKSYTEKIASLHNSDRCSYSNDSIAKPRQLILGWHLDGENRSAHCAHSCHVLVARVFLASERISRSDADRFFCSGVSPLTRRKRLH